MTDFWSVKKRKFLFSLTLLGVQSGSRGDQPQLQPAGS
jgi:hypothetical protein